MISVLSVPTGTDAPAEDGRIGTGGSAYIGTPVPIPIRAYRYRRYQYQYRSQTAPSGYPFEHAEAVVEEPLGGARPRVDRAHAVLLDRHVRRLVAEGLTARSLPTDEYGARTNLPRVVPRSRSSSRAHHRGRRFSQARHASSTRARSPGDPRDVTALRTSTGASVADKSLTVGAFRRETRADKICPRW